MTFEVVETPKPLDENVNVTVSAAAPPDAKFENISDNGSEISDEGYRSLGLIQQAGNGQTKRATLQKQCSSEDSRKDDVKNTGKPELYLPRKPFIDRFFQGVQKNCLQMIRSA